MHLLAPEQYDRVQPIFASMAEVHLNTAAVLSGDCPGQAYADNPDAPRTALIVADDCYYLAGDTHNQACNAALNAFLPGETYFILFCDTELWRPALDGLLQHKYAVPGTRRYYVFEQPLLPDWPARVPEGFSVEKVDAALLARGLQHTDGLLEGITCTWRTLDLFYQKGFGSCLVHGDEVAAWSLCDFVSGSRCEIGVNTRREYRRLGLGTLAAAATASYAAARGLTAIGWHCWANNAGSVGIAEKVGFALANHYDVYTNHWPAENATDMTTDQFRAFAEMYERWFEADPPSSGLAHWVAATAWALAGERGRCFRQLHRAVDTGWLRSVAQLRERWPQFLMDCQREQPEEWKTLRARLTD